MNDPHFIIDLGDGPATVIAYVHIGNADGTKTHHVSAKGVLKAFEDVEAWKQLTAQLDKSLKAERDKIRRLMAALADEVLK